MNRREAIASGVAGAIGVAWPNWFKTEKPVDSDHRLACVCTSDDNGYPIFQRRDWCDLKAGDEILLLERNDNGHWCCVACGFAASDPKPIGPGNWSIELRNRLQ